MFEVVIINNSLAQDCVKLLDCKGTGNMLEFLPDKDIIFLKRMTMFYNREYDGSTDCIQIQMNTCKKQWKK